MKNAFNANALHYPFGYATNPHAENMELKIREWLAGPYSYLPEKAIKKYLHTGVGHAGGCMFPRASNAQLTAVCRFYVWAFMIDDTFEFATVEELEVIRHRSLEVLRGSQPQPDEILYQQLPLLRQDLLSIGAEIWLERFCHSLNGYFDGLQQEIPYRKNMVFPAFDEFVTIREQSVNVYPLVDLAQAITGHILPAGVLEHPVLQRLAQLTCRILSWSNDYFSAHLEQGNDVLNLVLILQHERNCPLEAAYAAAIEVHDRDVATFCLLKQALPDFGLYTAPVVDYVENLALMIHGYLHWTHTFTERYKTGGHPSADLKKGQSLAV
ncbi:hypothetical protein F0L74_23700 [Chitinophaga agrisoli]|uniref:Terpene synthase n=1 Tax=Chitinophaga agrisoli TaxID=2607653 RepID=A0A5B2VK90_9BACT|nr:terpene synthase family protein [Chitinophaga agrisoli]KAA2239214.1 hypothetical protein F0L74_23700 [Chitinophaga agrisoli]